MLNARLDSRLEQRQRGAPLPSLPCVALQPHKSSWTLEWTSRPLPFPLALLRSNPTRQHTSVASCLPLLSSPRRPPLPARASASTPPPAFIRPCRPAFGTGRNLRRPAQPGHPPPTGEEMGSPGAGGSGRGGHECSFKILLIGDSGVGKSTLLVSFVAASHLHDDIAPTIGVDFKIKFLTVGGKKLKLTIWDTAGQERFRTITSSYYRGAQGIILVYDVTKRESFSNLADVWTKEIEANSTNKDCIKMLVGNKVDKDNERMVTREEGLAFAEESGCLFLESSAKTRENVEKCFEELALKILEVPSLLEEGSSSVVKRNILKQKQESHAKHGSGCCQ